MMLDKKMLSALSHSRMCVGFGAGVVAEKTLHVVQDAFQFFVDNSAELQGRYRFNCPVYPPAKLREYDPESLFIVICTTYYREIVEQLTGMGFIPGRHFGFSPLLQSVLAYENLRDSSPDLLVSTYGDAAGLYRLNSRTGASECLHKGDYRGMMRLDSNLYAVREKEGLVRLDGQSLEIRESYSFPNFTNALGMDYCEKRGRFYVSLAGRDEILVIDREGMREAGRIALSERFAKSGKEQHHFNDVLVLGDSLLISMFSLTGYWRQNVFDGSLVEYDLERGQVSGVLMRGLVKPHTIKLFEDDLYLVDSFRGTVYRGSDNPMASFPGFIRGLEFDGTRYYIGQSRNRHIEESYRLNRPMMSNCGVHVFLEKEWVYRFVDIPGISDIYDILDLTKEIR